MFELARFCLITLGWFAVFVWVLLVVLGDAVICLCFGLAWMCCDVVVIAISLVWVSLVIGGIVIDFGVLV